MSGLALRLSCRNGHFELDYKGSNARNASSHLNCPTGLVFYIGTVSAFQVKAIAVIHPSLRSSTATRASIPMKETSTIYRRPKTRLPTLEKPLDQSKTPVLADD